MQGRLRVEVGGATVADGCRPNPYHEHGSAAGAWVLRPDTIQRRVRATAKARRPHSEAKRKEGSLLHSSLLGASDCCDWEETLKKTTRTRSFGAWGTIMYPTQQRCENSGRGPCSSPRDRPPLVVRRAPHPRRSTMQASWGMENARRRALRRGWTLDAVNDRVCAVVPDGSGEACGKESAQVGRRQVDSGQPDAAEPVHQAPRRDGRRAPGCQGHARLEAGRYDHGGPRPWCRVAAAQGPGATSRSWRW